MFLVKAGNLPAIEGTWSRPNGRFSRKAGFLLRLPNTRACHQLAGFGRWAPSGHCIGPVSPDCHTQPSIGTGWYVADSGAAVSRIHTRSACWGADRCGGSDCAMTSGSVSRTCCRDAKARSESPRRTTGYSWRRCCIVIVPGCHGAICRSGSVRGQRSTCGSAAGPKAVSGSGCFSISPQMPTTNTR